jgi:glyoxylase-like metal-dependent hydrolase (beta-lactamase superfamily II)
VAEAHMPKWFATACGGCGNNPFDIVAYQVVYPDRTVIIDSCFDNEKAYGGIAYRLLHWFQLDEYYPERYAILQESMRNASLILVTHEHFDHIGGISASPYSAEIIPGLLLTQEQVDSPFLHLARFPTGSLDGYTLLSYDRYHAAAPGIVLIKAPGHAPGQQIIYVKTQDGNEYLLIGDVIWNRENLRRRTYRSCLASIKDDLDSAREEFRWVLENLYDDPNNKIIYVISHDRDQLNEYIKAGVIKEGFR